MQVTRNPVLDDFTERSEITGQTSYYVPPATLCRACREALRLPRKPTLLLNRPQAESPRLVHKLVCGRLTLVSTSEEPLSVRLA